MSLHDDETNKIKELSDDQEVAYQEIKDHFTRKDIVLLHGITSSGKTEVYVKLIQEQLDKGKQILFLLPEIALTTQLISRLRKYFGDLVRKTEQCRHRYAIIKHLHMIPDRCTSLYFVYTPRFIYV